MVVVVVVLLTRTYHGTTGRDGTRHGDSIYSRNGTGTGRIQIDRTEGDWTGEVDFHRDEMDGTQSRPSGHDGPVIGPALNP